MDTFPHSFLSSPLKGLKKIGSLLYHRIPPSDRTALKKGSDCSAVVSHSHFASITGIAPAVFMATLVCHNCKRQLEADGGFALALHGELFSVCETCCVAGQSYSTLSEVAFAP